jgi:hypothetical protein
LHRVKENGVALKSSLISEKISMYLFGSNEPVHDKKYRERRKFPQIREETFKISTTFPANFFPQNSLIFFLSFMSFATLDEGGKIQVRIFLPLIRIILV